MLAEARERVRLCVYFSVCQRQSQRPFFSYFRKYASIHLFEWSQRTTIQEGWADWEYNTSWWWTRSKGGCIKGKRQTHTILVRGGSENELGLRKATGPNWFLRSPSSLVSLTLLVRTHREYPGCEPNSRYYRGKGPGENFGPWTHRVILRCILLLLPEFGHSPYIATFGARPFRELFSEGGRTVQTAPRVPDQSTIETRANGTIVALKTHFKCLQTDWHKLLTHTTPTHL